MSNVGAKRPHSPRGRGPAPGSPEGVLTGRDYEAVEWLLQGDPAIRAQTLRDLLGAPENEWRAEQERIPYEGWGKRFMDAMLPDHTWPGARWTGTIYTLLTLIDLEIPLETTAIRNAAHQFLSTRLTVEHTQDPKWLQTATDLCHLGFWLRIGSYFGFDQDRLRETSEFEMEPMGGDSRWNTLRALRVLKARLT